MLFLTLNTFCNTGGIQNVSRAMSHALHLISKNNKANGFNMYALNDDNIADTRYLSQNEFQGFNRNKIKFTIKAIRTGIKTNTVILSHINLLFIALIIRIFSTRTQFIMMAHGKEVWKELSFWKRNFINKNIVIWAVSNYTATELKHHKIQPDRIRILPNCVDPFFNIPSSFQKPEPLLKRYQLLNHQPVILSLGRLTIFETDKGYDKVIRIIPQLLAEFPDLRYLICGQTDAKEKARLMKLISEYHLQEHVAILNFIPENELEAHYQLADIFILPSKKEGFGLVFIEAALCGCKVISGNVDGSVEALLYGKLGLMVDPDNLDQIIQALTQSLRERFDDRETKNIQTTCLNSFSHNQYVKNVKKLLIQYG